MKILGQEIPQSDLLRHSNPTALYGAKRVTVAEGRAKGQGLIQVKTADGLRLTILEDKGLDILDVEYRGVNLGFLSKNGLTNQNHTEMPGDSFVRYWQGGFLGTCGLRNVGGPCTVDDEPFPLHGRIGLAAAENTGVDVNDTHIVITGLLRETALFGPALEMHRTIEIPVDGAKIKVRDVVKNLTPEPQPIFLLYHINFGYPFLSEHLKSQFPAGEVKGRTPEAQKLLAEHAVFTKPVDGANENVFFHMPIAEKPVVKLMNRQLGLAVDISYDKSQLPVLAQWRCLKSGDYALGIEPSTSYIGGREQELANGYDTYMPAFGQMEFGFGVKIATL